MGHWVSHLLGVSRQMAVLLSLRVLPFAVHGVLTATAAGRRLAWIAAYLVAPTCAWMLGGAWSIVVIACGCAYYLVIGLGINRLSRLLADGYLTRGALAVVLLWLCLLMPGLVLPGLAIDLYLVVGMELALSAYSYCVETSRPGSSPARLRGALFFLLVNPTLVYSASGAFTGTTARSSGLRRTAAGVALMFSSMLCLRPVSLYLHSAAAAETMSARALAVLVACGVARFLVAYAAHSGLASCQIGLTRHAGWTVPERYDHPLRAASPTDFWRRWNTYRRTWLEAYVFLPLARRLARPTRRRSAQVIAAVATLLASGLIHDAYAFAGRQRVTFRMSELFLAAAALLVLWRCAAFLREAVGARRGSVVRASEPASFAMQSLSRAMLAAAVVKAAIVWG
jgi:hypothetical protein